MQKKRPILRRAWDFIAVTTVTPLRKVARSRIAACCGGGARQLALFKRARRLSLLRHHDYQFLREFESSPESTPLFPRSRWGTPKKRSRLVRLLMCGCDGRRVDSSVNTILGWPGAEWETASFGNIVLNPDEAEQEPPETPPEWSEGDESVDRRAEMFIEWFYDEMRFQRQDSDMERAELLERNY